MNDFSELEADLKQLRPAAPSAALLARVDQALAQTSTPAGGVLPRKKTPRWSWYSLGLGVAAAAAALLLLARPEVDRAPLSAPTTAATQQRAPAATAQTRRTLVPEGVTRVVYGTRDEGLVFPANSAQPMRRLRAVSQETLQWRDSATGASLRVSYPTEEVELVPAAGQ